MPRPTVPHCKDCKYHRSTGPYGVRVRVRFSHRCTLSGRSISGQEVRTSPSWCSLRSRGWRHSAY